MAKSVLVEEFHVTVRMPVGLSKMKYSAAVRTLHSKRFHARLGDAVRIAFRAHSTLQSATVSISR
jgi:hypothetical protein